MKLDDFLEIEKKYGLIEDRLNGFAYWTYFRYDLEWELEVQKNSYGEAHIQPVPSFGEKVQRIINRFFYLLFFCKIPAGQHDVLILNHERRVLIGNHYECVYTERVAEAFPDSVVLERPYFQKHFRPVNTKNLVYTDWITTRASVFYLWKKKINKKEYVHIKEQIRSKIKKPIEDICKIYDLTYSIDSILDKMVCGYYVYQIKRKAFAKILDKVQPKIILEVVGYNIDCMIVNELAAQRNIPTVELQHGTTGAEHIAYNYPENLKVPQFAQYFFAFSQFWTETARFPLSKEYLKIVGFPYMEQKTKEVQRKIKKEGKEKILFISQGTIGKVLAGIAVSLYNIMDCEKYEIIYKLHPGEYVGWRERYTELADSPIKVIDSNQMDLYELFAASTFQVGAYGSTATFEGLQFDLMTYILREKASSELQMLCEKGIAKYFESAEELYQMICENSGKMEHKIRFWKDNALDTMKEEMKNIMNCH